MKTTFIFLHGGPGFRDYLRPYFSSLENKFRCVFFDQVRGDTITIDDQLAQLDQILCVEAGRIVLVGHSWGGVLAIAYASRWPGKLAGLVLISTGLNYSQWTAEFRAELKALNLEDASPEEIFLTPAEQDLGRPLLDSTWASFSSETFESLSSSFLQSYDLVTPFSKLKMPILNIFGSKDVRFPTRVTGTFRTYNDQVVDFEIPSAGHFPFVLQANRDKIVEMIERTFAI